MSAREALFWALWDNYTPEQKNGFMDAFAHELAEKQRGFASATAAAFGECCESTALAAAALIDPEAPKDAPSET